MFLPNVPGTMILGFIIVFAAVVSWLIAEVSLYKERTAAAADYAQYTRSRANHPAGRALQERTRPIDRVGYDWVNGSL